MYIHRIHSLKEFEIHRNKIKQSIQAHIDTIESWVPINKDVFYVSGISNSLRE